MVSAQEASAPDPFPTEIVAQAGLIQPLLLEGGNVEVDLFLDRFVVSYSHGFLLHLEGDTVVGEAHEQGLALRLPFSTGLSAGYRFFPWLDLRGELKWHRFEVGYDQSRGIEGGELFEYDTWTVGLGLYGHWRPWRGDGGWLSGWNLSGSVRFWPQVASSLEGDARSYESRYLGRRVTHEAAEIGIANSPWVVNVSVGYAFGL